RASGADGPDRFVRDDELSRALTIGAEWRDIRRHLASDDRLGVAGEVLRLAFADAQDDAQPRGDRARELSRDARVVVTEIAAHLGVPDDRARCDASQHRGRDLPGVRAPV